MEDQLLVRTWNVFHGNTVPPGRRDRLERAIRLVAADRPDVVCLQEVPVWALDRLEEWSGMRAFGAVAARPRVGPLPSTASIGRVLASLHHGLLRSAFTGQANAILASRRLRPLVRHVCVLNDRNFRRRQADWLRLPLVARLVWAKERRVCHAVRFALDGRGLLVANLHATAYPADQRLADAEVLRAAVFADAVAHPDDVCVLAGDFNVSARRSRTLAELARAEWGFVGSAPGIDHLLVRGTRVEPVSSWPDERRRFDGRLLSDHAPVDAVVG